MVVHIIPDNSFLDVVIPLLLEASPHQVFVVLADSNGSSLKAIKKCCDKVKLVQPKEIDRYCRRFSSEGKNPFLVFHSLTMDNVPVIKALSNEFLMGWIPWGGCDIYVHYLLNGRYIGTFIREFFTGDFHYKCSMFKSLILEGILFRIFPILDPLVRLRRLFKWCFALTKEDYQQYRRMVGKRLFPAKLLQVSYSGYVREDIPNQINILDDDVSRHRNVIIGNMGSPRYNHYEVYKLLDTCTDALSGRKIYVPFGYGQRNYIEQTIILGRRMLGEAFSPLTSWMPKDDYFRLISSCGVYIANHLVQGGLGTMQLALMAGCKLYLNEEGATYRIFKEIGFVVFPIPKSVDRDFFTQLTLEQKKHNQSLCLDYWGHEKVINRFRRMVDICEREVRGMEE